MFTSLVPSKRREYDPSEEVQPSKWQGKENIRGQMVTLYIVLGLAMPATFAVLIVLLLVKRIGSHKELYFSCLTLLLYLLCAITCLPTNISDKAVSGLVIIWSALVVFFARHYRETGAPTSH